MSFIYGTINRDENGKPIPMSTAEFIYELMVNGFFHNEIDEFLLGILANNGDKTIVSGLTDKEKVSLNFLVRNQLLIIIALVRENRCNFSNKYLQKMTNLWGVSRMHIASLYP